MWSVLLSLLAPGSAQDSSVPSGARASGRQTCRRVGWEGGGPGCASAPSSVLGLGGLGTCPRPEWSGRTYGRSFPGFLGAPSSVRPGVRCGPLFPGACPVALSTFAPGVPDRPREPVCWRGSVRAGQAGARGQEAESWGPLSVSFQRGGACWRFLVFSGDTLGSWFRRCRKPSVSLKAPTDQSCFDLQT